jgi:hypothetical protein
MALFKNPNTPRQPQAGVYGWFFQYQEKTYCLYIGKAGQPPSHTERCTLFRGTSQLARATFSSDGKGRRLDTDFVVGCAIRYVESVIPVECIWEHLTDDPEREKALCRERGPLIQNHNTCTIHKDLKCLSQDFGWNITRSTGKTLEQRQEVIRQAEAAVFKALFKYIDAVLRIPPN